MHLCYDYLHLLAPLGGHCGFSLVLSLVVLISGINLNKVLYFITWHMLFHQKAWKVCVIQ